MRFCIETSMPTQLVLTTFELKYNSKNAYFSLRYWLVWSWYFKVVFSSVSLRKISNVACQILFTQKCSNWQKIWNVIWQDCFKILHSNYTVQTFALIKIERKIFYPNKATFLVSPIMQLEKNKQQTVRPCACHGQKRTRSLLQTRTS